MSINSPAEAEFVRKFTLPTSSECIWLGAKLKNSSYKWCDGSDSKYLDLSNNWSSGWMCSSGCCAVCLDNRSKLRSLPCEAEQRHVCRLNISCSETRDKILSSWNDLTPTDQSFLSVMFVTRNLQMTSHLRSSLHHVHAAESTKVDVAPDENELEPVSPTTAAPIESPLHHEHHNAALTRLDGSDARVSALANEVTQVKLDISSLKEEIDKLSQEVTRDNKLFKAFLLREKTVVETRRDSLSQHLSSLDPSEQSDAPAAPAASPADQPSTSEAEIAVVSEASAATTAASTSDETTPAQATTIAATTTASTSPPEPATSAAATESAKPAEEPSQTTVRPTSETNPSPAADLGTTETTSSSPQSPDTTTTSNAAVVTDSVTSASVTNAASESSSAAPPAAA